MCFKCSSCVLPECGRNGSKVMSVPSPFIPLPLKSEAPSQDNMRDRGVAHRIKLKSSDSA